MNRPDPAKREEGAAIIEFALALPLLVLLALGSAELFHYLRTIQQMEKTVQMTGGIVAQMTRVSEEDFDMVFNVAAQLLARKPEQLKDQQMRIRQYGCRKDGPCDFNWWRDGAGTLDIDDSSTEPFPSHVQLLADESLVHVILWLRYRPLIGRAVGFGSVRLKREAFFKTSKDYPLNDIIDYKRP